MYKEIDENILLFDPVYLEQKEYWKEKLPADLVETDILVNYRDTSRPQKGYKKIQLVISGNFSETLVKLCKNSDLSIYIFLLAALKALIYRYTGNESISVVSPLYQPKISGHTINNYLLVHDAVEGWRSFKELLLGVRQSVLEAYANQDYPFDKLLEFLYGISPEGKINRHTSHILCALKNIHDQENTEELKRKLSFLFAREEDRVKGELVYDTDAFGTQQAQQIANHFTRLLEESLKEMNRNISDICFLSEEEKRRVVIDFNDNEAFYYKDRSIHHFVQQHAEVFPDRVAAVSKGNHLSYRELNSRAGQLSVVLRQIGAWEDGLVGILMDRSLLMVVCILATWKAGGAYIPLDSRYPFKRIIGILNDAGATALLTQSAFLTPEIEQAFDGAILNLDEQGEELEGPLDSLPEETMDMSSLSYVIYTSGSTGKPKGAMVEHIGMMNHMCAKVHDLQLTERSIVAQNSNHTFDISVWQFFSALIVGGKTVIYNYQQVMEPREFVTRLVDDCITILEVVPSYLSLMLDIVNPQEDTFIFEYLLVTGEAVKLEWVRKWFEIYPEIKMVNAYGPTEASDDITHHIMEKAPENDVIPIGKPLQNFNLYILDNQMNLSPIGVKGEIYVSGIGVGRGYLNDEEKTRQAFGQDPFALPKGVRLYKTGDLGCWLPDGTVAFFGRKDYQVKIRGFRIELGEIEDRLVEHPKVKEAAVIDNEDRQGDKFLLAYVVLRDGIDKERVDITGFKEFLNENLPDYMIPSYFILIERLPLTSTGKVDKKALQKMKFDADIIASFQPPRDGVEEKLADVWSEVLEIERNTISINTSFFELGGHSLRATVAISRIHRALNVKVPLEEFFDRPIIRELAEYIKTLTAEKDPFYSIEAVEEKEYYDVSFAQRRIWVLSQIEEASAAFNIPTAIILEGELNREAFAKVLETLAARHESLRSVFVRVDDDVKQKILSLEEINFKLETIALREGRPEERESKARELAIETSTTPFDLEKGPLLRARLVQLEELQHLFLFTMHHIVSDLLSIDVLVKEVFSLYNAYKKGEVNPLGPLRIHYKDYAAWQNKQLTGEYLEKHRFYWRQQFKERPPVLKLPTDKSRPKVQTYRGDAVALPLSESLTGALRDLGNRYDVTLFMVLLAGLKVLLYHYTGQTDMVVGAIASGRDHVDLEGQIGFYLNTLALRTRFKKEETFSKLLERVKSVSLGAFEHQAYPFDKLVEDLGGIRDISRHPLFDVVVDMENLTQSNVPIIESNLKVSPFDTGYKSSKFDLVIYISEGSDTIRMNFEYNTDMFVKATIEYMARRFRVLLENIVKNPETSISDIQLDKALEFPAIASAPVPVDGKNEKEKRIIASYHQERLWFIDQFEAGNLYESSPIYHNIPLILEIEGVPDKEPLERCLRSVIKRHEALRTRIITVNNQPMQFILSDTGFFLEVRDGIGRSNRRNPHIEELGEKNVLEHVLKEAKHPFRMDSESLIRALFFPVAGGKSILLIILHHIIADRFSLGILAREIAAHYDASIDHRLPQIPELPLHYADFSLWQQEFPGELTDSLLFYWKRQLKGNIQALDLPTDYPRAFIHTYQEARQSFQLPEDLSDRIDAFSKEQVVSHQVVLLAGLKILFHRYTGQEEIVVGTSADNRKQPGTEGMIGPMANLLVLRSYVENGATCQQVVGALNKTVQEAYHYQSMPFDRLVLELHPDKDMSRTALFDVLFQYEETPYEKTVMGNLKIKVVETNLGWGKYDLNLLVKRDRDAFSGILVYNKDYYEASTISRFIRHYTNILEGFLKNPVQQVSDLPLLTEDEQYQLVVEWNQTGANYPVGKTIVHLFEEQVEKTPGNTAVVYEDIQLTYHQLNREVNRLSYYLKTDTHVRPNDLTAVLLERSHWMIIGLLAVLKSGSAYVPIDPNHPQERVNYILKESGCRLLIISRCFEDKIGEKFIGTVLTIDTIDGIEEKYKNSNEWLNNPAPLNDPEDTAYVIYTSGTTGRPKGCMVTHRNVVRLMTNDRHPFDFSNRDVWIMAHSYCFDFSVWEMYGALLDGGKLVVPAWDDVRDMGIFLSLVKAHKVTVLNQTPSSFYHFIEVEKHEEASLAGHLRYVIFGGEKLEPPHLKAWSARYPLNRIALINMFGITETTVHVTFYRLTDDDIHSNRGVSPIGTPLPETAVYICDAHLNPVPVGVTGELYVGGTGVCKGYLNRPRLTAEKFFPVSYRSNKSHRSYISKKTYKTGDLGRWTRDGTIEYLGRNDEQVKIRGYRIELGEIENQLLTHEAVKEAVLTARENDGGDRYLCAYIVSKRGTMPTVAALRDHLSRELPGYMVPSYFVWMERLPLTPNRKIDKRALPEPDLMQPAEEDTHYQAPRDKVEEKLVEIWSEVLGKEKNRIGIDSNFFELGGHSLNATILTAKIHKELNVKLPLRELFINPDIKGLAESIKESIKGLTGEKYTPIAPVEEREYYVLSSAQKRLYILQQMDPESTVYNISAFFLLSEAYDIGKLESSVKQLIARHESLRTSFHILEDQPVQKVHKEVEFTVEYYDCKENEETVIGNFVRPFDLSRAPLLHVGVISSGDGKHRLMVSMHHIISDGISMELIGRDFADVYKGKELPGLRIQYKDYAQWQNSDEMNKSMKRQEEYWLGEFKGEIPLLNLPTDYARPDILTFQGRAFSFLIDPPLTAKLKKCAAQLEVTNMMFLLSVYKTLLAKFSSQEEILVGTVIAGREHADLENVVGFFVNMLAIKTSPVKNQTFYQYVMEVKNKALKAYDNQSYPFEELVSKLHIERQTSRHPLVETVFVLQKFEDDWHSEPGKESDIFAQDLTGFGPNASHFDLMFLGVETHDSIRMKVEYSTALFKESSARGLSRGFLDILEQVVENKEMKWKDIEIKEDFLKKSPDMLRDQDISFEF